MCVRMGKGLLFHLPVHSLNAHNSRHSQSWARLTPRPRKHVSFTEAKVPEPYLLPAVARS